MNLKLYGICFKMRGGPDLLDHVQTGMPVPVDIMEQVMTQMGTVTPDEMAFAEKLDKDWKKAFNERVPLLMAVAPNGGYDITCTVPDELLRTVNTLTGMENGKIVEEYTASYLKSVCGVDATVISVDVEKEASVQATAEKAQGFDLSDLGDNPEGPAFEDISEFGDIEIAMAEPAIPIEEPVVEEPAAEPVMEDMVEDLVEEEPEAKETAYVGNDIPIEEGYPENEELPYDDAYEDGYEEDPETADAYEEEVSEQDAPESEEDVYQNAVKNIYTELVGNIREKKLDERLGLKIGQ